MIAVTTVVVQESGLLVSQADQSSLEVFVTGLEVVLLDHTDQLGS